MKLSSPFTVRKIGNDFFAIPLGQNKTGGMIRLNDSGAFLFERLIGGADENAMADALVAEYGIGRDIAEKDVSKFVELLKGAGIID